jgi:hypothetical protein
MARCRSLERTVGFYIHLGSNVVKLKSPCVLDPTSYHTLAFFIWRRKSLPLLVAGCMAELCAPRSVRLSW